MGPVLVTEHGALAHSVFVGLGVAVAGLVLRAQVRRAGPFDERFLVVLAGTLVGGALGMRAAGLVRYVSDVGASAMADACRFGAKSVLGALAGATPERWWASAWPGTTARRATSSPPAVALRMGVGPPVAIHRDPRPGPPVAWVTRHHPMRPMTRAASRAGHPSPPDATHDPGRQSRRPPVTPDATHDPGRQSRGSPVTFRCDP